MKIGILGAMEREVKSLCAKLENSSIKQVGFLTFHCGRMYGKDVVVVQCGIGKVNAALSTQILISNFGITHLINTGIAGAMAKGLGIFDFVVSSHAVYHDVDVTAFGYKLGQIPGLELEFCADSEMIKKAEAAFESSEVSKKHKMCTGRIASGDQFISGGERKEFIRDNFAPACVEMEGAAIAQVSSLNKIPFIIVRCMSDMADDNISEVYEFNEDEAALISADFVEHIVENF